MCDTGSYQGLAEVALVMPEGSAVAGTVVSNQVDVAVARLDVAPDISPTYSGRQYNLSLLVLVGSGPLA